MLFLQDFCDQNTCDQIIAVANIVMAVGILIGIISINLTRRQHFYTTVQACQQSYVNIVRKQQLLDLKKATLSSKEFYDRHLILYRDHLGLINEELFYMRNGNLPKRIACAWLGEMLKRIPVYGNGNILLNEELLIIGENKTLANYNIEMLEKTYRDFHSIANLFNIKSGELFKLPDNNELWRIEKAKFARKIYRKIRREKFKYRTKQFFFLE